MVSVPTHIVHTVHTSEPTGFLAAFIEVVPVGLRGDSWSISGRFTGIGMDGTVELLEPDLRIIGTCNYSYHMQWENQLCTVLQLRQGWTRSQRSF